MGRGHFRIGDGQGYDGIRRFLDQSPECLDLDLRREGAVNHVNDSDPAIAEHADDAGKLLFGPVALKRVQHDRDPQAAGSRPLHVLRQQQNPLGRRCPLPMRAETRNRHSILLTYPAAGPCPPW